MDSRLLEFTSETAPSLDSTHYAKSVARHCALRIVLHPLLTRLHLEAEKFEICQSRYISHPGVEVRIDGARLEDQQSARARVHEYMALRLFVYFCGMIGIMTFLTTLPLSLLTSGFLRLGAALALGFGFGFVAALPVRSVLPQAP